MKVAFFNVDPSHHDYLRERLPEHFLIFFETSLNDSAIPDENDADIISVFVSSKLTESVINSLPNLKMIALRSKGFDHVNLDYAKFKNITVSNVPSYGPHTIAEFTFALILALTRKTYLGIRRVKDDKKFDHTGLKGIDLLGKTLGVVGTGLIGTSVIKIAKGFSMNVVAFDIYQNEELAKSLDFTYTDLDNLLRNSDIVTIHAPATADTKHLFNQEKLALMKQTAYLINTARGAIVNTADLVLSLRSSSLAGYAADVLESEGELGEIEKKLIGFENVLITPHQAFFSKEA